MRTLRRFASKVAVLGATALACTSCLADEDVEKTEGALLGAVDATQFFWTRAAVFDNCTGTKIAPRFILTAAHCDVQAGETVRFYTSGPMPNSSSGHIVHDVFKREGLDVADLDLTDNDGNFADIAVVELETSVSSGNVATLAFQQAPSIGDLGTKVGASSVPDQGPTSMLDPPPSRLMKVGDRIATDDRGGFFVTDNANIEPGDSGGPIYDDNRVLGVISGREFFPNAPARDKYTSVPFFLNWILGKIGYEWPGSAPLSGFSSSGELLTVFLTWREKVCQYACDHTSACVAYNISTAAPICELLSRVDHLTLSGSSRTGLK